MRDDLFIKSQFHIKAKSGTNPQLLVTGGEFGINDVQRVGGVTLVESDVEVIHTVREDDGSGRELAYYLDREAVEVHRDLLVRCDAVTLGRNRLRVE